MVDASSSSLLRLHSIVSYSIVWWAAEPTSPEPPPKKQKADETDYAQVEEDLKKKKVSELKKDAKALGASEAAISDADDTSSPQKSVIDLIMSDMKAKAASTSAAPGSETRAPSQAPHVAAP